MKLSNVAGALLASSALFACAAERGAQVREELVSASREETSLQTAPPLIVADVLRVGDAKVVATELSGKAYVTRQSVGHELKVGFELAQCDLIELTPRSRLLLNISGHPAELSSLEKTAWYKLE